MVIYLTRNNINGKIYIGKNSTDNPEYLGSGDYLRRAIKKYGRENFTKTIIERCGDEEILNEREKFWIAFYGSTNEDIGYNLTDGGSGGDTTKYFSPEKKADYLKRRGEAAGRWLRSEEGRKACSEHTSKVWQRPGYREKMSKKMTGRIITWNDKMSEGLRKHYAANPPKPRSEEFKKKISLASKGRIIVAATEEQEKRIVLLYQDMGPKRMERLFASENLNISQYLIIRVLKKHGIYQRYRKGIKSRKQRLVERTERKKQKSNDTT